MAQQLNLAQSFNGMLVSPLSTPPGSTGNTLPSRNHRKFSAPHHHLPPSHSFSSLPVRNPQSASSPRTPHPSEPTALSHLPYEAAGCSVPAPAPPPHQLHSLMTRTRPSPNLFAPIPATHVPSSPNITNADGTYADVRLPFRWEERLRVRQLGLTLGGRGDGDEDDDRTREPRRGWVFEDSLRQSCVSELDYGGVFPEWCSPPLARDNYGLFEYSARENYTLQTNLVSPVKPEHLDYFKFIGRILVLPYIPLPVPQCYFMTGFYKMVLDKKVNLKDLEAVDYELYKGLTWMLENDTTGMLDEKFSMTKDRFSGHLVELRTGSATPDVTEANQPRGGLGDVLPLDLLHGLTSTGWSCSLGDDEDRHRQLDRLPQLREDRPGGRVALGLPLLVACGTQGVPVQFTTGTSYGPRRFTIEKSGDQNGLPHSHTCFNRLHLQPYDDHGSLERKLSFAIEEIGIFGQE
ncbi:hypothetical protein BJY52DRAFT_1208652 [Lactarius psammicola]|nr:hypothetical protein BJY52DRAFT_1208652 [Lactarius psammicola]